MSSATYAGVPAPEFPKMSLLQHLGELRKRMAYSAIAVLVGFGVCFRYADTIYGYMQAPITRALAKWHYSTQLIYLNPTEPFNLYLKIGLIAGVFAACPVVLYQVWLFVAPALFRNEKKYVLPFMVSTVALFLGGGAFGYFMVYPAALDFLIGYSRQFQPMITIGEYTSLFLTIVLGMGLIFELPILIFFLALMRVVSAGWLWRNLRYAILAIFVVAAIITPTTDIMNMCLFAAPMVVLYLFSIGVAWMVNPTRAKPA